jgi:RNA recognition motif-containing protein
VVSDPGFVRCRTAAAVLGALAEHGRPLPFTVVWLVHRSGDGVRSIDAHLARERAMRIYVGNLPYSVTDDELRDTFAEFGELASAEVVVDRFSGQSKGFGFVDMPNNAEADQAIKALNDPPLKGRKRPVNEARPRADRPRRGGGGGGYR